MQNFNILSGLCSRAGLFEPYMVGHPKVNFSRVAAHMSQCFGQWHLSNRRAGRLEQLCASAQSCQTCFIARMHIACTLPLESHKAIGFLSNTGPDPLKSHKTAKPAFNVGPLSPRQRNAISMAFRWWVDDGLALVVFAFSPLLTN